MTLLRFILVFSAVVIALGLLAVMAWFAYNAWLGRVEQSLARRKGIYRDLVAGLAQRERALLEPELHQLRTLRDFEAIEALLEEQAREVTERPGWLLDTYDRLGLVEKYADRLQSARTWRERAFAAELLGRVGNAKAVPVLLETAQATRAEDADVREIALRALARIADPRAVGALVGALKQAEVWLAPRIADILVRHGEPVVDPMLSFLAEPTRHPSRAWAANILGELRVPRAFPALLAALKDVDDEVRAKAAGALGKLGDRRAVSYLLDHLLADPAPFVRARIAGALGQFPGNEVIDRLVRALGDPAWWVRMRSVEALEQIGPTAETPLIVALDDPDPEIRIRAAVALERLGIPSRIVRIIEAGEATLDTHALLTKFGVAGARELLAELLHHPSAPVRAAVVAAIQNADRKDLATELIERAEKDTDPGIRATALDALHAIGARDAVPVALEALGDTDERVRAAATNLIGNLGGRDLAGVIRPRTTDQEPLVRAAAARALGLVRATGAEAEYALLLRDPDARVRAAAADGVEEAGWRGATPILVELLVDTDESVRIAAARALGAVGDASAVEPLLRAFADADRHLGDTITQSIARLDPAALSRIVDRLLERDDVESRVSVVKTLSGLRPAEPLRLLEGLFRDRAPEVRAAAATALGDLQHERAALLLTDGLGDTDPQVRARAVDGLVRLAQRGAAPRILALLGSDPSAEVRERAALACGIFRPAGGEVALLRLTAGPEEELPVRAAATLALGAYDQESIVARVVEMADEAEVRDVLRERLKNDSEYRLLGLRLREARHIELRALGSSSREQMEQTLAEGMRGVLSPEQRVRLVAGLRAFQGERSRSALLSVVRSDPSPEVRAAALTAVGGMLDASELHLTASRALADPHKAVRHAAVGLFSRIAPEKGLPGLMRLLKAEDDPLVLQMVAQQAEAAFPAFLDLALGLDLSGQEAILLTRVARYMHHPGLRRVLGVVAQSTAAPVREAVAALWATRPDLLDPEALGVLGTDPDVAVRRATVRAWRAARSFDHLVPMLGDPDPGVRQEIARAWLDAPDAFALEPFFLDPDEMVRAALLVTRILRGEWTSMPDAFTVSRPAAATAVRLATTVETLRDQARTAREAESRLAAALALAIVGDEAAWTVMRSDPVWSVRDRVGRMLAGWRDAAEPRHAS
ncbi:MAG TPA: HEAT repeat domain-containing protein [Gemmatimonadales bacterium]|nr:HEAT repeat domain-containing protein [Gemmatimonadales bacterium]